jgi:hypothetical protein
LADNSGLDKLEEAIKTHFSALENMQRPFPVDWLAVREALECKTQPYISLDKYQEICEQNNIPEKLRQQDLGQYLHDLGVLLHYKEDDFLQHKIFLQPTWVTKAVYELIDFMGKGQFTAQDAKNIWEQSKYEGTYEQMHLFLLKIIAKFELCYEQNGMYVMPQLLSAKVPTYTWDTANNLQIQFEYAFPLQGIFWRLIVRLHRLIGVDNVVWKEGVIFEKKYHEQTTKALVTETYKNKVPTIMVKVAGLQRKDLLAVIMHEIETINGFYNFSETQAPILKVPCNCELCNKSTQPQLYEYKKLLRRLENKKYEVECEESFNQVTIRPLLDDVFDDSFLRNEAMRTGKEMSFDRFGMLGKFDSFEEIENYKITEKMEEKRKDIFISYSHHEEEKPYFDEIKRQLATLKAYGLTDVHIWDDTQIRAGDDWLVEIKKGLAKAKVGVLLVSPNFLASKFIGEKEVPALLEAVQNDNGKIMSVIVRKTLFEKHPILGKYQSVNPPSKPLNTLSEPEKDEVYAKLLEDILHLYGK